MNAPTPLFYYALYALPFVVAVIVLAYSRVSQWRAAQQSEMIERPIITPEDPMVEEVRSQPMRRHYVSYASSF